MRWMSTSTASAADLVNFEDALSFAHPETITVDGNGEASFSYSERQSVFDKRSLQEEYKRLTESRARRQRDARQN
jgi:hypothetical protein